MRVALVQLTSSDDPQANLPETVARVEAAADDGARLVLTPEVTNCVSGDRGRQLEVLRSEDEDPTLARLRGLAARRGVWILIGSLALKLPEGAGDPRFVNRSLLVAPSGEIAARYDKMHMFDARISETEVYRESASYRPGERAVLAEVEGVALGMTICYDLRFPALYRRLAQAGAQVLTAPSAFSPVTGAAHWEPLLRARAIETGAYVLAPAQCGRHEARRGRARRTHGHSLAVSPWGELIVDLGDRPGVALVELALERVAEARRRVPSLTHDRAFTGP